MVRRRPEDTADLTMHRFREMVLPSGLIAIGLVLTFVEARLFLGNWNPIALVAYVAITTVINLAMIFAALLLTARLLDLGLGEIGPALLKIAAVAILPSAVGGIIREGLSPFGGYLAFGVTIVAVLVPPLAPLRDGLPGNGHLHRHHLGHPHLAGDAGVHGRLPPDVQRCGGDERRRTGGDRPGRNLSASIHRAREFSTKLPWPRSGTIRSPRRQFGRQGRRCLG